MDKEKALANLEDLISKSRDSNYDPTHSGRALGYIRALADLEIITLQEFYSYVDRALGFDE